VIAAITAGGRVDKAFAAEAGTAIKALAPLDSSKKRLLIDAAIDAAQDAGADRIAVVGGDEVRSHISDRVSTWIAEAEDGRENLRRALAVAGDRDDLLLLTSDLPFIQGVAVRDFLARLGGAALAMPLASEATYRAAFPDAADHATNVGGDRVVNASIFFFRAGVAGTVSEIAQQFFDARKSRWRMARLLGPGLLLRFATGRLQIADVERRAKQVFGLQARAITGCDPSLCFDIDTLEDYRYALARISA